MTLLSPLSCLLLRGRVAGGSLRRHSEPWSYAVGGETRHVSGPSRFAGSTQVSGGPRPGHLLSNLFVTPTSPALGEAACSDS